MLERCRRGHGLELGGGSGTIAMPMPAKTSARRVDSRSSQHDAGGESGFTEQTVSHLPKSVSEPEADHRLTDEVGEGDRLLLPESVARRRSDAQGLGAKRYPRQIIGRGAWGDDTHVEAAFAHVLHNRVRGAAEQLEGRSGDAVVVAGDHPGNEPVPEGLNETKGHPPRSGSTRVVIRSSAWVISSIARSACARKISPYLFRLSRFCRRSNRRTPSVRSSRARARDRVAD